jgi:hypothetical protein
MGIDEGTGSARTIIFDEEGQTVAEVARELTQYYPKTGWHHHDPKQILHFQLETMRQALKEARLSPQDIRSIGVTNQRETALVWDKASGEPVYNAIVWTSRQSVDIIERWAAEGLSEDILQKTGLPNDAWFSASKIAWDPGERRWSPRKGGTGRAAGRQRRLVVDMEPHRRAAPRYRLLQLVEPSEYGRTRKGGTSAAKSSSGPRAGMARSR